MYVCVFIYIYKYVQSIHAYVHKYVCIEIEDKRGLEGTWRPLNDSMFRALVLGGGKWGREQIRV